MDILQHLYTTYEQTMPSKLEENDRAIKKDYDLTLPIEHLAEQMESAMIVAGNANQPCMAVQVYTRRHAGNGTTNQMQTKPGQISKDILQQHTPTI
eukprot:7841170-Ditylum_brightwellii.AAC.1